VLRVWVQLDLRLRQLEDSLLWRAWDDDLTKVRRIAVQPAAVLFFFVNDQVLGRTDTDVAEVADVVAGRIDRKAHRQFLRLFFGNSRVEASHQIGAIGVEATPRAVGMHVYTLAKNLTNPSYTCVPNGPHLAM
jgi:hypothetical protein